MTTTPEPTTPDAGLERWRLILGAAAERHTGPLGQGHAAQDAALDWLYGRDPDLAGRGVRRSGTSTRRTGGDGPSPVTAIDWLDDIHRLFPKETIERLERTPSSGTASRRSSPTRRFWSGSSRAPHCCGPYCAPST